MHSPVDGLQSGHAASTFPTTAPNSSNSTTTSTTLTGFFMVSLLEFAPLAMKALAVAVLVAKRPGRHAGILAVLAFSVTSAGALYAWPGMWSVTGYVIENSVESLCIALAAVDAVRRLPDRRLILFQMAAIAAASWVGGLVVMHSFPPDTVRTAMVRVHFAAAAVAGMAAGTGRLDRVDDAALRWLFVTRVALCMRLPLIGTAAHPVLSGASTVAWAVVCYLVVHHCLTADDPGAPVPPDARDPRP